VKNHQLSVIGLGHLEFCSLPIGDGTLEAAFVPSSFSHSRQFFVPEKDLVWSPHLFFGGVPFCELLPAFPPLPPLCDSFVGLTYPIVRRNLVSALSFFVHVLGVFFFSFFALNFFGDLFERHTSCLPEMLFVLGTEDRRSRT